MFDVTTLGEEGSWCLANKRVFAHCDKGFPDGIKCDVLGNVYSGCGDGVHVFPLYLPILHLTFLPSFISPSHISIDSSFIPSYSDPNPFRSAYIIHFVSWLFD